MSLLTPVSKIHSLQKYHTSGEPVVQKHIAFIYDNLHGLDEQITMLLRWQDSLISPLYLFGVLVNTDRAADVDVE